MVIVGTRPEIVKMTPSMRKAVLVIRLSTERPEAVEAGFARVVGVKKDDILAAMERGLNNDDVLPLVSPYGNGEAGKRIVDIIVREEP